MLTWAYYLAANILIIDETQNTFSLIAKYSDLKKIFLKKTGLNYFE